MSLSDLAAAGTWPSSTAAVITATAVATTAFLVFGKASLWPRRAKVLPNPLKTLVSSSSAASEDAHKGLVYKPDQFPGARDVETPYGSVRVYEFGPEDGEKVLFIHGISTSCVTLGRIADGLVERGCRVMLYDLFGRGFTDGVGDLPYDERLYVSQILFVLASSPLAWTGRDAQLRVIGYSLGGGIAVHFANTLPDLVASLVLLAPAGLINAASFGAVSRFVFSSGVIPERILAVLTRRRLQQPIAASKSRRHGLPSQVERIAKAEAADPPSGEPATPLEHRVLMYIRWMVLHHTGFVPAFMSSIRHSPLTDQHEHWRRLADREKGSTAIILATDDEIIDIEEYNREAPALIGGKDHVMWRELPGGHDFVMTHAKHVLEVLDDLWPVEE